MKKIHVLLLLDEAWNDKLYGNNNMTNWFEGFEDIELATIYCSPEIPDNHCCSRYYQITDYMMLDSILHKKKAGRILSKADTCLGIERNSQPKKEFSSLKKMRTEFMRFCRDILWLLGQYDEDKLLEFIRDFQPDIIFSQRLGSVKLCRLEKNIVRLSKKPLITYTGDNEYSLRHISLSPFFWIRKLMVRSSLNKNIPMNELYYTVSEQLSDFYGKKFNISTKLLFKCGEYKRDKIHRCTNKPIKIVYAGKLYCGRWKTLAMLADAIKQINKDEIHIVLEIYTRDDVSLKQRKKLDDNRNFFLKGAVSPDKIQTLYDAADIALHVESFDYKNRLLTQHSYSTKVIDCLSSGCAVMAIGWKNHSACVELKRSGAAFVITSRSQCIETIQRIVNNPRIVVEYAYKAMENVKNEHSREKIQKMMYNDFLTCIETSKRRKG